MVLDKSLLIHELVKLALPPVNTCFAPGAGNPRYATESEYTKREEQRLRRSPLSQAAQVRYIVMTFKIIPSYAKVYYAS